MSAQASMTFGINVHEVRMEQEMAKFQLYQDDETASSIRNSFRLAGLREISNKHYGAGYFVQQTGR